MRQRSIFTSLYTLLALETFYYFALKGKSFGIVFLISVIILIVTLLWTLRLPFAKWFSKEILSHTAYLVLPIIFYTASLMFSLLIRNRSFKQLFIFASAALFFIILTGIRGVILNLDYKIKPRLTYNILTLSTLLTIFLSYSIIWAFFRDLSFPIWIVLLIFFVLTFLLSYQIFHLTGAERRRSVVLALFTGLAITQISWIFCFWPIEYFFLGMLLTIVFYFLWGLSHHQFENNLTKNIFLEYLLVSGIIFILVLWKALSVLSVR